MKKLLAVLTIFSLVQLLSPVTLGRVVALGKTTTLESNISNLRSEVVTSQVGAKSVSFESKDVTIKVKEAIGTYLASQSDSSSWAKTYGGSGEDWARSVASTSDGGFVVTGETVSFGAGRWDIIITKFDSKGGISWSKTYGTVLDERNYLGSGNQKIIQLSNGDFVIEGYTNFSGTWKALLIRIDSSGNLLWAKTYGGDKNDWARSVVSTSDGGFVVAGETTSFGAVNSDFLVFKVDSSGNISWARTFGGSGDDWANSVAQTSEGGFIVSGATNSFGVAKDDALIIKLSSSGDVQWAKTFGGIDVDWAFPLIQTSDGGFAVAGETGSFGAGNSDFFITKIDPSGTALWTKTYGGADNEWAFSIVQTSDGDFILTGGTMSYGSGGIDCLIMKTSPTGDLIWAKTFGGNKDDMARAIVQASDGGFFVVGGTESFSSGSVDSLVIKIDKDGNIGGNCNFIKDCTPIISSPSVTTKDATLTTKVNLTLSVQPIQITIGSPQINLITLEKGSTWAKVFGGDKDDMAYNTIQTSNGGFVVAGDTNSFGAGNKDFLVIKTGSSGELEWAKTFGGEKDESIFYGSSKKVIQTPDGGFLFGGYTESFGAGARDMVLVKIDSNGKLLWAKTYGGISVDNIRSIMQTPDNGFVVAGETGSFGTGSYDILVVKVDQNGLLIWAKTYGGTDDDWPNSIISTSDGKFTIAGATKSFGAGNIDFIILQIDSNGKLLWAKTYGGIEEDIPLSILQTSDNGFIVVGDTYSFGMGNDDALIVKINQDGSLSWAKTFGGTEDDWFRDILQTSDNGFIAVGASYSFGMGNEDALIVKINQDGSLSWAKTFGGTQNEGFGDILQTSDNGFIAVGASNSFGVGKFNFLMVKFSSDGNMNGNCNFLENCNIQSSLPPITVKDTSLTVKGNFSLKVQTQTLIQKDQNINITRICEVMNVSTICENITYTIVSSAGDGGSISPSGSITVNSGADQTFTITPNTGYKIKDVLVDGISVGAVSTYTFTNVTADHTIEAVFEINSYTIKATAGVGGSITPSGLITVNYGGSQAFEIYPDKGYLIKDVLTDGISIRIGQQNPPPLTSAGFSFDNITANHTIEAIFEKETLIIILKIGSKSFTVNGVLNTLDSPPVIKNGRTLLPIRAVVEALGGNVDWDATEKKVTVSLGSNTIELWIGKSIAKVNGNSIPIDATNSKVVPEIINDRTMLPLRFVTENLGCQVQWDGTTQTITITYLGG